MTRVNRLGLYIAFAVLATFANLAIQRLVLGLASGPAGFAGAILLGTFVGLAIKYVLDKRWIFNDRSTGAVAHSKKFAIYSTMGIFTTMIFWATETIFWLVWQTDTMRELGAVIGLTIGYATKYQLDRRFVFTDAAGTHPV